MATEDVFNGALRAFMFGFAYFNTVAQEIGMERALELLTKMCESMAPLEGQVVKQQLGIQGDDAKAALALIRSVDGSLGKALEVLEESPEKVVWKTFRCPIYEAAQMLGIDAKTICRRGFGRAADVMIKQINANMSYQCRKFRSSADDFCEEAVVMGEPYRFPE